MPHGTRAAAVVLALTACAAAAPVPARGQPDTRFGSSGPLSLNSDLARPDRLPPPRFPEPRRGAPPPAPPGAAQALGAAPSLGGIMTEQQARDRIAAAGFTDVRPLQPGYHGNWTGHAAQRGRTVRVTIDPQGNISTRQADNSARQGDGSGRR